MNLDLKLNYKDKLRSLRLNRGIKQTTIASALDTTCGHICQIEKGKSTITLHVLEKLADFYGMPLSSLIHYVETPQKNLTIKTK